MSEKESPERHISAITYTACHIALVQMLLSVEIATLMVRLDSKDLPFDVVKVKALQSGGRKRETATKATTEI